MRARVGRAGQRDETEFVRAVDTRKHSFPVLEVEQAHQPPPRHEMLEERPGRVVGGDAGRHDEPGAPRWVQQTQHELGEHGVGVHVARSRERETAARPRELAGRFGFPLRLLELPEQSLVGRRRVFRLDQPPDHPPPRRLVRRGGNARSADFEELLLMQLEPPPRRVPQHDVEAAPLHGPGERQRPVKEAVPPRELAHVPDDAGPRRLAGRRAQDVRANRHDLAPGAGLRREEGAGEQVGAKLFPGAGCASLRGLPRLFLAFHLPERPFGHLVQRGGGARRVVRRRVVQQAELPRLAVRLPEIGARGLLVPGQRLVRAGGNPFVQHRRIEDADQTVSRPDVRVEEGERLAGLDRLHPQRRLAEFHRERIPVDAVNAAPDNLAQRSPAVPFLGRVRAGLDAGNLRREPPGGGEQEVARTAGRVEDLQVEQRRTRILGPFLLRPLDDRNERRLHQFVDQARRRVVGAGQFLLRTLAGVAREVEGPGLGVHVDRRLQFEQALVDGTEFLGVHIPVVHPGQNAIRLEPGEVAHRLQEIPVGDQGGVDIGAPVRPEQSAERRQAERGGAARQAPERDPQAQPQVGVPVVVPPPERPFAQPRRGVALSEDGPLLLRSFRPVEKTALLRRKQEQQAVDEAQDLLEVAFPGQGPAAERPPEIPVPRMHEEAIAEAPERLGHAEAKVGADPLAGVVRLRPPLLDDAGGGQPVAGPEPARVDGEPERREVGVQLVLEDQVEIRLDEGRPGKARVVPQEPEPRAVRSQAPQRGVLGVEVLLQETVRRLPPVFLTETGVGPVEVVVPRGEQDRNRGLERPVADPEHPAASRKRRGRLQVLVAEDRPKKGRQPLVHADPGSGGGGASPSFGIPAPEVARDQPVAADLVLESQRLRQAVIGARLPRRIQCRDALQVVRRKHAALKGEADEAAAPA